MKVLCIDGGGIRGLIPALVLAEIEQRCGKPTAELFDLIAGTSTGAIVAATLVRGDGSSRPLFSARDIADLYIKEGPAIFHRSIAKRICSLGGLVGQRFDDKALNRTISKYLGPALLSDARTDILLPAYDIRHRRAFFFRSACARVDPGSNFVLADAVRAAVAAPTYFAPVTVTDVLGENSYDLVDGGVYATNPALVALTELIVNGRGTELDMLVSLGTGSHTRPINAVRARKWGQLQWVRPLVDVVFDGIADTTEFELRALLTSRYHRLQTELRHASDDLDNASAENLDRLTKEAQALVIDYDEVIDKICEQLEGDDAVTTPLLSDRSAALSLSKSR